MALRTEHLLASFANQLNTGSIFGRRAGGYAPNVTTKERYVMSTTNVWVAVARPNDAAAKLGIPRSMLDMKIKQLKINKYSIR